MASFSSSSIQKKSDYKILLLVGLFWLGFIFQPTQSQFRTSRSTSVMTFLRDSVHGLGAGGVNCTLSRLGEKDWEILSSRRTNSGGMSSFSLDGPIGSNYKLTLEIQPYYSARNLTSFYPYVEIIFERMDNEMHLIPIIISPMSYSAYRGHTSGR